MCCLGPCIVRACADLSTAGAATNSVDQWQRLRLDTIHASPDTLDSL